MARSVDEALRVKEVMALFDLVVESSKEGVRKPDPRFYLLACERLGIQPRQAVFLDDLGINLKSARALGMTTIKVNSEEQAIGDLSKVLGIAL
jgi:putative hydrolase of the HAD superfamily